MSAISPEQLEEIIERATNTALKKFEDDHPCRLSQTEIAMVKAQHEAMVEEGANHGTLRVLIQWGVNLTDITKQCRRFVLLALGVIALVVLAKWKL